MTSTRPRRSARKPPVVRCQCGRLHRSWNPYKVCAACVRERRSTAQDDLSASVRELERRRLNPTSAEREQDRAMLAAIHAQWLARQTLDHPWRVAGGGGEA